MPSEKLELARALLSAESGAEATSSAANVAAAVDRIWVDLARHFARLIGDTGVHAVLERTISIASARWPWLIVPREPLDSGPRSLRGAFEGQTVATAVAAFDDLITTFIALLGRFIGDELVKRLLAEAWPAVFPFVPKESP